VEEGSDSAEVLVQEVLVQEVVVEEVAQALEVLVQEDLQKPPFRQLNKLQLTK
jgi:endonuclease III-like uncharacterized protein